MDALQTHGCENKGQANQTAHQQHSANRTNAEDEQINQSLQARTALPDFSQDQQRQGRRARQAMHHPDHQRTPAQPCRMRLSIVRAKIVDWMGIRRAVKVQMRVRHCVVRVRVDVHLLIVAEQLVKQPAPKTKNHQRDA